MKTYAYKNKIYINQNSITDQQKEVVQLIVSQVSHLIIDILNIHTYIHTYTHTYKHAYMTRRHIIVQMLV